MKKSLLIAIKDLRVLIADKAGVFWVFGFPIMYALFFGAIFSDAGNNLEGMNIAVVDEDRSELSEIYISCLDSYNALAISRTARSNALELVRKGKVVAAVIVRPGFGDGFEALFDKSNPRLEVASDPSRKMESGYLQGLLAKAQFEALGKKITDTKWVTDKIAKWRKDIQDANDISSNQRNVLMEYFDSLDNLITDVNQRGLERFFSGDIMNVATVDIKRDRKGPVVPFQITFPQAMIWGVLACAATFAISIVKERSAGTFQRLRVAPINRFHILSGKGLACFFTCIFVMSLQSVGAMIIFKMPIASPALFVVAAICTALCVVGLMMFACTLGRTEQSAGAIGWAVFIVMAMLGGGMLPLFLMPDWMRGISNISPVKWGIYAMEGAIWRKFSLLEMLAPCAVLLVIGALGFSVGLVILRRRDS